MEGCKYSSQAGASLFYFFPLSRVPTAHRGTGGTSSLPPARYDIGVARKRYLLTLGPALSAKNIKKYGNR